tara:strand:+ start:8392 stop:8790 length:399 start_codon:yes stop_codon:yes gene_type:complete
VIECSLQPVISRYSNHDSKKPKYGVYLQSMYWGVKGYGKSTWVVSVKIELDYDKVKEDYENDDEIISKCIEYLNTPPKSKYGKRRKRKPLYTFDTKPYSFEIIEKKSKKLISARLITKERKNKHFWNAGPSL